MFNSVMNKLYLSFVMALLALSFLTISCDRGQEFNPIPEYYTELLEAYNLELRFTEVTKGNGSTDIHFSDGRVISIPLHAMFVYDCTTTSPSEVTLNKKTNAWMIGAKDTGIPFTDEKILGKCTPVYIYYTNFDLCIFINNGEWLTIGAQLSSNKPLSDFRFLKKNNPSLSSDLNCFIIGDEIKGMLPEGTVDFRLIPSFNFSGKSLSVDGVSQKSGASGHDFSRKVTYAAVLSDGTTRNYTVSLETVHPLPTVYLTTEGQAEIKDKENYVPGSIRILDPDGMYSDVKEFECTMGIRGRGNTTWDMPKKPWKVKLSEKKEIFGISKNKNWAVLANYSDKTLLRNTVAMELSRILGMKWTPEMKSVEVYLNGDYQGCYSFSQHKEVSKDKVNIEVVTESDNEGEALTGGYYIEIDGSQDEDFCFWTQVGIPVMMSDPEVPTTQQREYIKKLFSDFETALYSDNFRDPQEGYAKYIDVDSFIKFYIIQELSKNVDGNLRKSTFITKERGKKMEMYHVWDFDIAFGNCNYFPDFWEGVTNGPEGWFVKDFINYKQKNDGWFGRLFKDPAFVQRVKEIWNEAMPALEEIPNFIDYNATLLGGAPDRNFNKWKILDKKVWPNVEAFGTYDAEINYLKSFYTTRLKWLDKAINAL